jgi:hypothetical protein
MSESTRLEGVQLLWLADYWDGPIAGLARFAGREHWFEAEPFDWDDPPSERRYWLYALTDDEVEDEREWHGRFQQHVGTHTDYDISGARDIGAVRPRSEWSKFYDEYKRRPPRDYTSRQPVGWLSSPSSV